MEKGHRFPSPSPIWILTDSNTLPQRGYHGTKVCISLINEEQGGSISYVGIGHLYFFFLWLVSSYPLVFLLFLSLFFFIFIAICKGVSYLLELHCPIWASTSHIGLFHLKLIELSDVQRSEPRSYWPLRSTGDYPVGCWAAQRTVLSSQKVPVDRLLLHSNPLSVSRNTFSRSIPMFDSEYFLWCQITYSSFSCGSSLRKTLRSCGHIFLLFF